MSSPKSFETDRPIADSTEDRLARRSFAAHAARVLARHSDEDPIVVGLYGPWGAGKTSILNLITKELEQINNVSVVRFNPWYFTGEIQLLEHFFEELAAALGSKAASARQEAVGALQKYLRILKPTVGLASLAANALIPGSGSIVQVITEVAAPAIEKLTTAAEPVAEALKQEASLEDTRRIVSDKLLAAGVRLVVLVDDIDRLYPEDARMVFKLVRLVGDLPCISYLLSFDPNVVASSIARNRVQGEMFDEGQAYLEKIIQVALPLPKVRKEDLQKIAFDGINAMLERHQVDLSPEAIQRLVTNWIIGIGPGVSNIREIKRIVNAMDFAIGLLKEEVEIVDLMLFEALRIVYPKVFDVIRREPHIVLESSKASSNKQDESSDLSVALGEFPGSIRKGLESLLHELFPCLDDVEYSDSSKVKWRQQKRITSEEHLEKVLGYGVPSGIISDAKYNEMLVALRAADEDDGVRFKKVLEQLVRHSGWSDLIWRLRQEFVSLSAEAAYRLVTTIVQRASELPRNDGLMGGILPSFENAAVLAVNVVGCFMKSDSTIQRCAAFVRQAETIPFSAMLVRKIRFAGKDESASSRWGDVVEAARSAFRARVGRELKGTQLAELGKDDLFFVLYEWKESAGVGAVESLLADWFAADASGARVLVSSAIPFFAKDDPRLYLDAYNIGRGYDLLASIVTPEFIASSLGYNAAHPLSSDELDKAQGLEHHEQARLLFLKIYQQRLTSSSISS